MGCVEGWREAIVLPWKAVKKANTELPSGSVVKNLLANAEDTVSIPDLGRLRCCEELSSCTTATEPVLLSPGATTMEVLHALESMLRNKRSHHHEKPTHN